MNIAGRIIQNKRIYLNDSDVFFAKYKGHEIHASLFERNTRSNNKYSYAIIKIIETGKGGNNKNVCSGILQRCQIHDVLVHAINEANL